MKTFVWFNYRRVPAVALAHQMVKAGRLGEIRHVRATYLQDWAGESVPLLWRFDKSLAGSGAHGDLNAHIIDMTRFVTGQEITEIAGAIAETFIKERALAGGVAGGGIADGGKTPAGKGKVTVDDTVLFLARFSGGAVASFEAARQATGNQNRNTFEINGTKGSLKFDFERMNELQYYDATLPRAVQGWTTIMCTHGGDHPYVANWWPDAHIIGYEHGFTNQAYDILQGPGRRGADGADSRFRRRLPDAARAGSRPDLGRRTPACPPGRGQVTASTGEREPAFPGDGPNSRDGNCAANARFCREGWISPRPVPRSSRDAGRQGLTEKALDARFFPGRRYFATDSGRDDDLRDDAFDQTVHRRASWPIDLSCCPRSRRPVPASIGSLPGRLGRHPARVGGPDCGRRAGRLPGRLPCGPCCAGRSA